MPENLEIWDRRYQLCADCRLFYQAVQLKGYSTGNWWRSGTAWLMKILQRSAVKTGSEAVLRLIKRKGIRVGMEPAIPCELHQSLSQAHMSILEDIDYILTSDEVPNGKPAPDIYLMVAEHFWGCSGALHGLWGYSNDGMRRAAISAGMKSLWLRRWIFHRAESIKKELSDYYITSYEEILNGTLWGSDMKNKFLPIFVKKIWMKAWYSATGFRLCDRRCLCWPSILWTCHHQPGTGATWIYRWDHFHSRTGKTTLFLF